MSRFISLDEILHKGRFANKNTQAQRSNKVNEFRGVSEPKDEVKVEPKVLTDAPLVEEAPEVGVVETPVNVEPTITDAPAAEVVEMVTDAPDAVEATVVEEDEAPKKKGGKKAKANE